MEIKLNNYILDIYKTSRELWAIDYPFITIVEIYNLERTVLFMKIKFPQDYAERIYSSLLHIADNLPCDNMNPDFGDNVSSIGIDIPLFEMGHTYTLVMTRESNIINIHIFKKNLNNVTIDLILLRLTSEETSILAMLIYDEYESMV